MDNLDIVNASFGTPDPTHLQVTLRLKDLEAPPPPANLISGLWTVYWTYKGTVYYAQATSNGSGSTPLFTYSDGTFSDGNFNPVGTPDGIANTGPNGTFVMTVPRADVGDPPDGATLTNPFADVHGSFTVLGTGVYYTAAADRAPDSNFGASYVVGQVCVPVLAPAGGGPSRLVSSPLPATAGGFALALAGSLALGLRRRRAPRSR
jgi:hypothetical protein